MPTLTIAYRDDAERLALEQAIAYVAQLRQVAQDAPDGSVLAACEQLALAEGRFRGTFRDAGRARLGVRAARAKARPSRPGRQVTSAPWRVVGDGIRSAAAALGASARSPVPAPCA